MGAWFGDGSVMPQYGVSVDLYQFSELAKERSTNDTMRDFISYYGKDSQVEVYKAETPTTDSMNLMSFGEAPEDLKKYINNMEAFIGKNIAKIVASPSDAEFKSARDEMIETLKSEHHVDEIYQHFFDEASAQKDQVAKLRDLIQDAK